MRKPIKAIWYRSLAGLGVFLWLPVPRMVIGGLGRPGEGYWATLGFVLHAAAGFMTIAVLFSLIWLIIMPDHYADKRHDGQP